MFTATEDATYYVSAGAKAGYEGTYTLSVTGDDFRAGVDTTGTVAVGGSAEGEIDFTGDRDWFAVTLEAGKTYRIDLKGYYTGSGSLSDPHLHGIHDANGVLIDGTTNDNSGPHWNSRVVFTATEDAIHYVSAGTTGGKGQGTYKLKVTELADDFSASAHTNGTVAVGGSAEGEIEFEDDQDWFAVMLEAGKTYRIDLEGARTSGGTLANPYLQGIHDANGVLIDGTSDDDGGPGRNSRMTYTAATDATYYISARSVGDGEGTYTLSVTDVTDGVPDDYCARESPGEEDEMI